MRVLGYLLGACIVLAIVRAAAAALLVALGLAIVVGAFSKPRETFGLLGFILLCNAIESHGTALILGFAIVAGLSIIMHVSKGA